VICIIHNLVIFNLLLSYTYILAPVVLPPLETPWKCSLGMAVRLAVTFLIFCVYACVKNYDYISSTDAKQRRLSPDLRL
jgi:hypothetical protein